MDLFQKKLGAVIDVELLGDKWHTGILVDAGQDILVLYNGERYIYIPTFHILNINLNTKKAQRTSPLLLKSQSIVTKFRIGKS